MDSVESTTCASKSIDQQFAEIVRCCDRSQTGKRLPGALYVHVSALSALERSLRDTRKGSLQDYENLARQHLKKLEGATLVKFSTDQPRVSYLSYPDFDTDAHPALQWSVQVDLVTSQVGVRNYSSTDCHLRLPSVPTLCRTDTIGRSSGVTESIAGDWNS
jgi:DNA phosphorothioation-associated putative methyltransferase